MKGFPRSRFTRERSQQFLKLCDGSVRNGMREQVIAVHVPEKFERIVPGSSCDLNEQPETFRSRHTLDVRHLQQAPSDKLSEEKGGCHEAVMPPGCHPMDDQSLLA